MDALQLKISAANAALDYVKSGMRLGVGTGSTADEFTKLLGEKVQQGLDIQAVPTSERTQKLCNEVGIKTYTLEDLPQLDLTIDGADELDHKLQLIKGGGGALLREKIVAGASSKMIVIADTSKTVETLGAFPLPIEVVPFGLASTTIAIENLAKVMELSGPIELRKNSDQTTFVTDGGHFILDASFSLIYDAKRLCDALNKVPGVVENGLFIDMATTALVAGTNGVNVIEKNN
ncbi:ribose-5-phosphate isomerase RpiA [Lentilitoribacter sp. Alg239-R112]|uniref:ribose-5-phosphate isomerase RpiA n=1 Tax=Lentilitoribacter sp. Alg239-R112 TaxID=2305987 RepID=UPI0013A6CF86|nr:ribose-5-phosphate isomerase RpiA [Lentilitoribacter sp. Alg239-R112]